MAGESLIRRLNQGVSAKLADNARKKSRVEVASQIKWRAPIRGFLGGRDVGLGGSRFLLVAVGSC